MADFIGHLRSCYVLRFFSLAICTAFDLAPSDSVYPAAKAKDFNPLHSFFRPKSPGNKIGSRISAIEANNKFSTPTNVATFAAYAQMADFLGAESLARFAYRFAERQIPATDQIALAQVPTSGTIIRVTGSAAKRNNAAANPARKNIDNEIVLPTIIPFTQNAQTRESWPFQCLRM